LSVNKKPAFSSSGGQRSIIGTNDSDPHLLFLKNELIPESYKISMFFAYLDEDDPEEVGVDENKGRR
jgi:hypothetical protein